jgi:hypothetical protein
VFLFLAVSYAAGCPGRAYMVKAASEIWCPPAIYPRQAGDWAGKCMDRTGRLDSAVVRPVPFRRVHCTAYGLTDLGAEMHLDSISRRKSRFSYYTA